MNPLLNRETKAEGLFPISKSLSHQMRHKKESIKKKMKRRLKKFITPENSGIITENLPRFGESTHLILRGDFVLGDFLPKFCEEMNAKRLICTTLSVSEKNVQTLEKLLETLQELKILVSSYFVATDKANCIEMFKAWKNGGATVAHSRIHTKLILAETGKGHFVFEGSANLRSSSTIEQLTIYQDKSLFTFHESWIDEVIQDDSAKII